MTTPQPEAAKQAQPEQSCSVLYNADCPVCNFEISHYAAYSEQEDLSIRFDDLNSDALAQWEEKWGLTADKAARRLYVLHEGELVSGVPAFRVLWAQMPKYRWLVAPTGWPIVKPMSEALYDHVLAPMIYGWHMRRKARQSAST